MENNTAAIAANFTVGDFTVHGSRNLIVSRGGEETAITPKMLAVLTELATHQGKTLSKEHLLMAVWGTLHTSDMVLSRAISDLRKVFGDSARRQAYIETVTKKGYRLKQEVNWRQEREQDVQAREPEKAGEYNPAVQQPFAAEPDRQGLSNKKLLLAIGLLVFVLLLAGIWRFTEQGKVADTRTEGQAAPTGPTLTYLTRDKNYERYLRYSPDGKMLAYTVSAVGQKGSQIRLHSLADDNITFLAGAPTAKAQTSLSYEAAPAFSPDGREIAYKHFTDSGCLIRAHNLLDGSKRGLAPCPHAKTQALDWSPEGRYLVTTVFNDIKKIEGLALVHAQTGDTRILSLPEHPASGYLWPRFSPDGNSIAVVNYQPNSHLWTLALVDVNSGAYSEVLATGEEVSQVLWDESGSALYYLLVNSSDDGIWKINLETKATEFIAGIQSSSLDFDEVTGQFACIARERQMNIWQSSLDAQGNRVAKPLFKNLPQSYYPSLSADNSKLAFVSTASDIDSLWLRSLDDNVNHLVFQAGAKEKLLEPAWSPDGRQLLISVLSQDASRMIVFDLELGNAVDFASENNVKMGQWSRDGARMYWYEEIDGVWQVMSEDLASGQRQSILSYPLSRFAVADKNNLHYQKIGTVKVHTRALDGSRTPADSMLLSLTGGYEWDAHGDVIYYMSPGFGPGEAGASETDKRQMLFKIDMASGESQALYAIDPLITLDSGRHLSVSSDGAMAFYTRMEKYHTEVALIGR
ncbi:PD40 domain-containing protein [Thalassomonas viridans]|uniref:PD40 domain-containing protein n=1 Tax=Thalassomonas viridans TaxID=137584 RepID=A0AAE9Z1J6_9GAMM|nr:winged helix-turn-helix domain-containing protein [Thalassomonas viridans]WDE04878.1 PD40 domain-containing protein [Thalassomonas viridans]